jgi:hypothetical protein
MTTGGGGGSPGKRMGSEVGSGDWEVRSVASDASTEHGPSGITGGAEPPHVDPSRISIFVQVVVALTTDTLKLP